MALTRTSSYDIVAISVSLIDNYDIVFLQLLQKLSRKCLGYRLQRLIHYENKQKVPTIMDLFEIL